MYVSAFCQLWQANSSKHKSLYGVKTFKTYCGFLQLQGQVPNCFFCIKFVSKKISNVCHDVIITRNVNIMRVCDSAYLIDFEVEEVTIDDLIKFWVLDNYVIFFVERKHVLNSGKFQSLFE